MSYIKQKDLQNLTIEEVHKAWHKQKNLLNKESLNMETIQQEYAEKLVSRCVETLWQIQKESGFITKDELTGYLRELSSHLQEIRTNDE